MLDHRFLSRTEELNHKQQGSTSQIIIANVLFRSSAVKSSELSFLLSVRVTQLTVFAPLMNLYQVHLLPLSILNICMNLFDKF